MTLPDHWKQTNEAKRQPPESVEGGRLNGQQPDDHGNHLKDLEEASHGGSWFTEPSAVRQRFQSRMAGYDLTPAMSARNLVVKLHIYAGLLTFVQLAIYGVAGLVASTQRGLVRPAVVQETRFVPFTAEASATDKQVADAVFRVLQLPLTRPMPDWFLRRTAENDLLLDFYNINGIWRVVVLERENRLRIDRIRNSAWLFLADVHAATTGDSAAPRLVRLWALYNEMAMWCLLAFCCSGVYLWLSAQARSWWAWGCLLVGPTAFAGLWSAFR
jgi:hypothetical protein